MENTKWELYDLEALKFAYDESKKMLEETFISFRQNISVSYVALGFYAAAVGFGFTEFINRESEYNKASSGILAVGMTTALIWILGNLLTSAMTFPGAKPESLITEFFETKRKEEQLREMVITKLIDHKMAIDGNILQLQKRATRFNQSCWIALFTILLCCVTYIIC